MQPGPFPRRQLPDATCPGAARGAHPGAAEDDRAACSVAAWSTSGRHLPAGARKLSCVARLLHRPDYRAGPGAPRPLPDPSWTACTRREVAPEADPHRPYATTCGSSAATRPGRHRQRPCRLDHAGSSHSGVPVRVSPGLGHAPSSYRRRRDSRDLTPGLQHRSDRVHRVVRQHPQSSPGRRRCEPVDRAANSRVECPDPYRPAQRRCTAAATKVSRSCPDRDFEFGVERRDVLDGSRSVTTT